MARITVTAKCSKCGASKVLFSYSRMTDKVRARLDSYLKTYQARDCWFMGCGAKGATYVAKNEDR